MNRQRRMGRAATALAVLATLVTAGASAGAQTGTGHLDLAFGSCGASIVYPVDPDTGDSNPTYETGRAIAVQPDGKIVTAGDRAVHRRLPDGMADHAFGVNGMGRAAPVSGWVEVRQVAVQPDGRIVVAGWTSDWSYDNEAFYVARFLPSGAVDTGFGTGGHQILPHPGPLRALALQADGRILLGGNRTVLRLLPTGALDTSFGSGGMVSFSGTHDVAGLAVHPDGRVLVGANILESPRYDGVIIALRADGSTDPAFGGGRPVTIDVASDRLTAVGVDGSGRIVAAGTVSGEGQNKVLLARMRTDGSPDVAFGDGGVAVLPLPATFGDVAGLVLDGEGRPVLAVRVTDSVGRHAAAVMRVTTDGEADGSFGTGGAALAPTDVYDSVEGVSGTPQGDVVVVNRVWGNTVLRFAVAPRAGAAVTPDSCRKTIVVEPGGGIDWGMPAGRGTPHAFTVTNTGTAATRVARVTFMHQGRYTVLSDTCTARPLAPAASCQVVVSTSDTSVGWGSGTPALLIWHDGEGGYDPTYLFGRLGASQPTRGWGWNVLGSVGAGPVEGSPQPRQLPMVDTVAVASGYFHSLALRADGTVWAWGWNAFGQLGDGTTVDRPTPVQVPGLSNIGSVAAGAHSSFAIARDGTVHAWGWNASGQLGDGSTADRTRPVRLGGLPPMTMVSGGAFHTLAVAADHTAWSWGWNGLGQLGDGSTATRLTPQPIPGARGVKQVAAGMLHSLSVTLLGSVSAWGWNGVGQLGDGTNVDSHVPRPVPGLDRSVGAVAAGGHHSLAIYSEGPVAWGWNALGQLGDGTFVDRSRPVVVGVPRGDRPRLRIEIVTAGVFHSMAKLANGTVWSWGWNGAGQLGHGGTQTTAFPTRVDGLTSPGDLAAGYGHSLSS